VHRLHLPLSEDDVAALRAGDRVLLCGALLAARDAAHQRFAEALGRGQPLPVDLAGQVLYYVGPTPARPGEVIGSAGPTTASRMDPFTPALLALGLKGTIGKGGRSPEVVEAMRRHRAVYFGAVGGAGALLSRCIRAAEVLAYEDLGPEAVRRLVVEDFPVIVVNDIEGRDLFQEGRARYRLDGPGRT
jgi:fumarate hydratase subunit beta